MRYPGRRYGRMDRPRDPRQAMSPAGAGRYMGIQQYQHAQREGDLASGSGPRAVIARGELNEIAIVAGSPIPFPGTDPNMYYGDMTPAQLNRSNQRGRRSAYSTRAEATTAYGVQGATAGRYFDSSAAQPKAATPPSRRKIQAQGSAAGRQKRAAKTPTAPPTTPRSVNRQAWQKRGSYQRRR